MAHDVFLSHAAVDRAAAQGILAALESSGVRCWIAPRDIPAGAEYGEHIVDAVKSCRVFVVVFSAAANASPHVRREVERAVSTDRTIVPFRIENVTPSGAMEYCLGGTHWFDAFGGPVQSARLSTARSRVRPAGCGSGSIGRLARSPACCRPSSISTAAALSPAAPRPIDR